MNAKRSSPAEALLPTVLAILSMIAGLALASAEAHAQAADTPGGNYTLDTYLGIHTVNFTQILSGGLGSAPAGLAGNMSKILEMLRNTSTGCLTLSCLASNQSAREALRDSVRELANTGYIDPYLESQISEALQVPGMSYDDLRRLISSPEIASLVSQVAAGQGNITASLGILDSLFRGGRISLNEYLAALELLKRAAISSGLDSQAAAIDAFQLDVLRKLILSKTAEDLIAGLGGLLSTSNSQVAKETRPLEPVESGASAARILYTLPSLGSTETALLAQAAAGVAIAAATVFPAYFLARLLRRRGAPWGAGMPEPVEIRGEVVKIYWEAVRIFSKRVPRRGYETHREYLIRVRSSVEKDKAEPFERITSAYEAVRFAREPEERFSQSAEEDLKRILEKRYGRA